MPVQTGSPPSLVSRAATEIIYDSLPDPLPVSLTSQNFQARRAAEFGQQIQFAGTDRALDVVTIGMVTWGYYSKYFQVGTPGDSWTHPVTLNVYAVNLDDSPGTLLASITKTVDVPWRAEPNGAKCQYPLWFADADQRCHNGMAFTISFDFTSIALTLPDKVIFGVAFNTQSAGASPYGIDGPYNDLAVGFSPAITVGTSPVAPQSYLNSSANDAYADGGLGGTNYFRLDVGSDEPAIAIKFGPEPEGPGELVGVDGERYVLFRHASIEYGTATWLRVGSEATQARPRGWLPGVPRSSPCRGTNERWPASRGYRFTKAISTT
jgi:hypothetical protein